jgi:hypothetical protein
MIRKDNYQEAIKKFNDLITESEKVNSNEWTCKSLNNILMIRCKEGSPEVIPTLSKLMR